MSSSNPKHKISSLTLILKNSPSLSSLKKILAHVLRHCHHHHHHRDLELVSFFNLSIRLLSKFPTILLPYGPHSSLHLFLLMSRLSLPPNNFTFPFLLNSCAALRRLPAALQLHARLQKSGLLLSSLPAANALIDSYSKCHSLPLARQAFDEMPQRDLVSHNALLGAHARLGTDMDAARHLFDGMLRTNVITWNAMLVGYVNAGQLALAREVFDRMPVRNEVSWTVLVMGYCKSCLLDEARGLFDRMPGSNNLVSWSVMITGYSQSGRPEEALALFREMERNGIGLDAATMTGVISAAAQIGRTDLANSIGYYVDRKGIERNERVLTALIDMHAKCGNVDKALLLFEEISQRDAFAYAALINGIASHGYGEKALEVFYRMLAEGVKPDYITFVGVLSACSHAGLVDEGLEFWESMVRDYGIERGADHYACVVDMLSRVGRLEEAFELAGRIPTGPHAGSLGALLAGCKTHCNLEIAESVAAQLFELEPRNTGNYILLSSIYASREQWEDAARIRRMMNERCSKKNPGSSWY